jgi:hypothetical protein
MFSSPIIDPVAQRQRKEKYQASKYLDGIKLQRGINLAGGDKDDDAHKKNGGASYKPPPNH